MLGSRHGLNERAMSALESSDPFKDLVPSLSLRENERGREIGGNWDPTHHQPTDMLTTFNHKDYILGLTSAQTTLGALGRLVGAVVRK